MKQKAYWTEEAEDAVSLTFDAVDDDKQEALEAVNFVRRVTRGGAGGARARDLGGSAWVATALVLLAVVMRLGPLIAEYGLMNWAILVAVGALVTAAVAVVVDRIGHRPIHADVHDRFTIRLAHDALTCTSVSGKPVRIAASNIAEIIGGKRVSVVTQDARTIVLPFAIDETAHASMAAELNARLRDQRASAGGYRGTRVDVAERTEEQEVTETDEASSDRGRDRSDGR